MRQWWKEKDYSELLNEKTITAEPSLETIVKDIYSAVCSA